MKRKVRIITIVAGVVMYIALDHNPMGEYCEYSEHPLTEDGCVVQ